jgi:hypothetical protein
MQATIWSVAGDPDSEGIQFPDGGMYAEWRQTHMTEKLILIRVLAAAGGGKSNSGE